MTRTHIWKTCPYCKKVAYSSYLGSKRELWGSPLHRCSHCGKLIVDNEYNELARWDYEKNHYGILDFISNCWASILLGIFPAAGLLSNGFGEGFGSPDALIFLLLLLAFLWGVPVAIFITRRPARQEEYREAWEESNRRLQDKEYVMFLKNSGYFIPEHIIARFAEQWTEAGESDDEDDKINCYHGHRRLE